MILVSHSPGTVEAARIDEPVNLDLDALEWLRHEGVVAGIGPLQRG